MSGLPVVVIATLIGAALLVALVWLWRRQLRTRAELVAERERHAVTAQRAERLELLELAARQLGAAGSHAAIADRAADTARALVGASRTVLVLTAADDLVVAVPGAQRPDEVELPAEAEEVVHDLARQVRTRGATVRHEAAQGRQPSSGAVPHLAVPLRDGDVVLGALVLARPSGTSPFSVADAALVERLSGHVALAVARSDADPAAPRAEPRAGAEAAVPAQSGPPVPPPQAVSDLAMVVRTLAGDARERAEAQGQRRRVAVLAPTSAPVRQPSAALEALVRTAFEVVIDGTEPGTNIAVEVLAQEAGWELVIAHHGEALDAGSPAASELAGRLAELGGQLESGQGAGVARIRARLPGAAVLEPTGDSRQALASG